MKVIDARSGQEVALGTTIRYPDGESITVKKVNAGLLQASAYVIRTYRNPMTGVPTTDERWVPLVVRWLHPGYPFQHVAFLPT